MAESERTLHISDVVSESNTSDQDFVVRCRGLPYSATPEDLKKFFSGCSISEIQLTQTFDSRPTGEAFIELEDEESYNSALNRNKDNMGKRYIEVFESEKREMDYQVKKSKPGSSSEGVIRLRGLPFNCTKDDIMEFFSDFQLMEDGVVLVRQSDGRASGEGFVQLASPHKVDDALKLSNGHIGHRYVELFPSNFEEMNRHSEESYGGRGSGGGYISPKTFRPSPYDRPGHGSSHGMRGGRRDGRSRGSFGRGGRSTYRQDHYRDYEQPGHSYEYDYDGDYDYDNGSFEMGGGHMGGGRVVTYPMRGHASERQEHMVRMRGLPFSATDDDIYQFFYPYVPSSINIRYDSSGRASGEAEVGFSTHGDAKAVLNKDRQNMGRRYIELFLDSEQDGGHASFRSRGGSAPRTGAYGRSSMTGAYSLPPPGTHS